MKRFSTFGIPDYDAVVEGDSNVTPYPDQVSSTNPLLAEQMRTVVTPYPSGGLNPTEDPRKYALYSEQNSRDAKIGAILTSSVVGFGVAVAARQFLNTDQMTSLVVGAGAGYGTYRLISNS